MLLVKHYKQSEASQQEVYQHLGVKFKSASAQSKQQLQQLRDQLVSMYDIVLKLKEVIDVRGGCAITLAVWDPAAQSVKFIRLGSAKSSRVVDTSACQDSILRILKP